MARLSGRSADGLVGRYLPVVTLTAAVVSLLLLASPAFAAKPPFRFRGTTSQDLAVSFQIPYSFIGIRKLSIYWDAKCTSGATLNSATRYPGTTPFNLNRAGFWWRAPGVYRYTAVDPDYSFSNGRKLSFRVTVANTGKVHRNVRPTGTWSTRTKVTDPSSGQVIDTCTTGRVTWKADIL